MNCHASPWDDEGETAVEDVPRPQGEKSAEGGENTGWGGEESVNEEGLAFGVPYWDQVKTNHSEVENATNDPNIEYSDEFKERMNDSNASSLIRS